MFNYSLMLKKGNGIIQNYHEALKYFKLAADKGNNSALFNLALTLYNGEGTSVPHIYYALMMKNGDAIENNIKEAIHFFKMAADKGNLNALSQYKKLTQFIKVAI